MRISERTGSIPIFYPHFIIQTIIYTAKGGLDESSPYNKSNPNKIWKNGDKKWSLAPFYYHFIIQTIIYTAKENKQKMGPGPLVSG